MQQIRRERKRNISCYNNGQLSKQQRSELAFLGDDLLGNVSCLSLWNNREKLSTFAPKRIAVQSLPANVLNILSMTSLRHDINVSLYLRGRNEEGRYVEIACRKEVRLLTEMNDSDFESCPNGGYSLSMPQ